MKLIEQLIKEKIDRSEEHFLHNRYEKGVWDFYCAFQVSKAFLVEEDIQKREKSIFWKNFILDSLRGTSSKKRLIKIFMTLMQGDFNLIAMSLKKINKTIDEQEFQINKMYDPKVGIAGVLAYEYPEWEDIYN